MPQHIVVTAYSPEWAAEFERESEMIKNILKDNCVAVHHIGSTAVAGLKAKPIIDMMPIVADLRKVDELASEFEKIGYEYLGEFGIAGRRYLRKGGAERTHQIHIFEATNQADIERHLAVRDYLRTHNEAAEEYGNLKEKLAREFPYDIDAYCDGKEEFVKKLEKTALEWKKRKSSRNLYAENEARNMTDWNADQYLKFMNQRTQPAVDLAMRIIDSKPRRIADIGCGPGNSTYVLKKIFPDAELLGIDLSSEMIEKARKDYPDIEFRVCDALALAGKYDLLFSNACLQWIPDHDTLLPSLMDKLSDGGILAAQVPINEEEPLFKLIKETAAEPEWGLQDVALPPNQTLAPQEYFDILAGCSSSFDLWETKYYHVLDSHKALVEWVKGTRLRPYLAFLGETAGKEFEKVITDRVKRSYPVRKSGDVVFGFRRLFFTAKK